MLKKLFIVVGVVIAIGAITTSLLYNHQSENMMTNSQKPLNQSDVISESGIHWHPELAIYIKGQQQEIPADIGIGKQYASSKWYDSMMDMTDFHTHDTSGTLHWEVMAGPVTKEHVMLKAFFDVWGKTFNAKQIFDYKNGPDGNVKMTVNGQPNNEFENYQVKDKDKIVIRYE